MFKYCFRENSIEISNVICNNYMLTRRGGGGRVQGGGGFERLCVNTVLG